MVSLVGRRVGGVVFTLVGRCELAETVRTMASDRGGVFSARRRRRAPGERWDVLLAVAVGGALGSLARYGLAELLPHDAAGFPWATFLTNAIGCMVIGGFMVVLTEMMGSPHR